MRPMEREIETPSPLRALRGGEAPKARAMPAAVARWRERLVILVVGALLGAALALWWVDREARKATTGIEKGR